MKFKTWLGGIPIRELVKRIYYEVKEDRSLGRAAELGFYFVLSLFPLLIFLLNLLSFVPDSDQLLMRYLSRILPDQALDLIKNWAGDLMKSRSSGLLSFGILLAVWSASNGVAALMDALNHAYEVKEGRPFWKARIVAILLVFALSFLVLGGAILVSYGDTLLSWLSAEFDLFSYETFAPKLLRYLVGIIMLYGGLTVIYIFGPNTSIKPRLLNAGAIFAFVMSVSVSYLFSLYLRLIRTMNATYGSLGAFIILMLSLYLISLVIIIGAELNSEIEKAEGTKQSQKE